MDPKERHIRLHLTLDLDPPLARVGVEAKLLFLAQFLTRFDEMDTRLDRMGARFDRIETQQRSLEEQITSVGNSPSRWYQSELGDFTDVYARRGMDFGICNAW